ncbi:hypothetical protein GCM10027612_61170 [Microbispora bryophytorum subsp. camponoti]
MDLLRVASRCRATGTAAPNAGYESYVRRLGDRDPATVGIPGTT